MELKARGSENRHIPVCPVINKTAPLLPVLVQHTYDYELFCGKGGVLWVDARSKRHDEQRRSAKARLMGVYAKTGRREVFVQRAYHLALGGGGR
jgi:exosome complex RNA-binding protein Rrp4